MNRKKGNRKNEAKPVSLETYRGTFVAKDGFGFIDKENLYVKRENMNTALNKDLVEYIILKNEEAQEGKKYEAQITRVIERARVCFSGNVIHGENNLSYVLLDNPKLHRVATVEGKYEIGSKVMVKLTNFDPEQLEGKIVKVLGSQDEPDMDIRSILEEFEVSHEFPPRVQEIAEGIQLDMEKRTKEPLRRDFTAMPLVTIDPENSKDFDDAIGVEKNGENYRLWVAIADVWSYIRDHPELIEEAEKRSTSIYYLNSVIPMLPERLCNDYCSLVPNQKRCAVVFEVTIDSNGNVLWETARLSPAVIISRRRFTYEEVNEFLNGENDFSKEAPEVKKLIENGYSLHCLIQRQRNKKGYIQLENPETKFNLSEEGEIVEFNEYIRGKAQFMIENFMIMANEGVARVLTRKKIPGIFRSHNRPEINKILSFVDEVKKVDFQIDYNNAEISQKTISRWFEDNKTHPLINVVKTLLLKSLPKAVYSPNNSGHFGLNLENYLHFTSPIRRYPDVMVHRMIWEYIFEEKELKTTKILDQLETISKNCTEREIDAGEISKAIENSKIIQYLNRNMDKVFKAKVTGITKWGCFAKLEALSVEGFIKTRQVPKLGDSVLIKPIYNTREMKLIKIL